MDEACAVRCTVNDKPYLKVFVTLNTPTPLDVVKKSVEDICSANLIRYSVPRFVEVLDKMPRTDFGKIDYVSLEKRCNSLACGKAVFCYRRVKTI